MSTAPTDQQWTIQRLLEWTKPFFGCKGLDEPVYWRLRFCWPRRWGSKWLELYTRSDQCAPGRTYVFRELVNRAADHVPIAYLVGFKEFYSLILKFRQRYWSCVPKPKCWWSGRWS
ncbi:MAG: hypothetical protein R3E58_02750 [Phycisphaerae bacterium]